MGNNVLHSERMYVNMKIVIKNLEIEISPDEIKYLQMANEIKRENEINRKRYKKNRGGDKENKRENEKEEEIKNTKIGF